MFNDLETERTNKNVNKNLIFHYLHRHSYLLLIVNFTDFTVGIFCSFLDLKFLQHSALDFVYFNRKNYIWHRSPNCFSYLQYALRFMTVTLKVS